MSDQHAAAEAGRPNACRFRLYVAGKTPRTRTAVGNLRRLAETLGNGCETEIIDVVDEPERAEEDRVLATPTLIKESPPPRRRVTGDLSDLDRVMSAIGLQPAAEDSGTDAT